MSDEVESIVPQRLVLVLPTSGAFDSRSWRIARTAAGRGHHVTVIARSGDDLPAEEASPAGPRVIRVGWDAVDGLPFGLRQFARAVRARRLTARGRPATGGPRAAVADPHPGVRIGGGRLAMVARAAWRLLAIGLTVRSQGRATLRAAPPADLVHAMAYMGIPVGLRIGHRDHAPVVYDARDIYVEARTIARLPRPMRHLFAWMERHWAQSAARVITVNEPYAEVMARRFRSEAPLVVMNCSDRLERSADRSRRFHDAFGLDAGRRVVLYHGGFSRDRGIEQLLEAIGSVPEATLVCMGYGELEGWIRGQAAGREAGLICVMPAVPPAELIDWVAAADVVAMPIQPSSLNHRLTTPNKLFEAIAAGVPVVASDLPGMATIVRSTGCGRLVDPTDPASIATGIRAILEASPDELEALRVGLENARDRYNWQRQADILLAEYGRLTGRGW